MSCKISFIMASYLGEYEGGAKDRVRKFHRAVHSFNSQTYKNCELIIVSDGCHITCREALKYNGVENIKLVTLDKQPLFSGYVRSAGNFIARGNIIAYLDSDDLIGTNHAQAIINGFEYHKDAYWVYFDDKILWRFHPMTSEHLSVSIREVKLELGSIGTSAIAHKNIPEFNWIGCDHYQHDWLFIQKLINSGKPYAKIYGCDYNVCHIPQSLDT